MDTNNPILEQEDMYFDTSEFNFLDLEDVVEDNNALGYNTEQTSKDLISQEEIDELDPDGEEVDELPPEDGDPVDEDEGEESDEDDGSEESEDGGEDDGAEGVDEEVDFEGYELTLPSGETLVLADVVAGYKNAKELAEQETQLKSMQEEFDGKAQNVGKFLELAKLEADRVIEDYEEFDWNSYKKDDPVGYVENREFLDKYKARRKEIVEAMETIEAEKAEAEAADFRVKAKEAGVILARDIPGWNNDMYQQLMMYAVEQGAKAEDVANSVDPVMFKILHKAMQFEKGKQTVKAKVKRLGASPTKVVKSAAKGQQANPLSSAKRAVLKKMESGGLSESEHSNVFSLLED